jgi:hypothetical protein
MEYWQQFMTMSTLASASLDVKNVAPSGAALCWVYKRKRPLFPLSPSAANCPFAVRELNERWINHQTGAESRLNTQNVNAKTVTRESNERWGKSVLTSLETLQMKASKACLFFSVSRIKTPCLYPRVSCTPNLSTKWSGFLPWKQNTAAGMNWLNLQVKLQMSGRESEQERIPNDENTGISSEYYRW